MRTVNIHEAKTNLSRLVEEAAKGEPFLIAKVGKPLVKVPSLDAPVAGIAVPDDFDRMGSIEIERLLGGNA